MVGPFLDVMARDIHGMIACATAKVGNLKPSGNSLLRAATWAAEDVRNISMPVNCSRVQ